MLTSHQKVTVESGQKCMETLRDRDNVRRQAGGRLLPQICKWPTRHRVAPHEGECPTATVLMTATQGTAILEMRLRQPDVLAQIVRHLFAGSFEFGTGVDSTLSPSCQAHKCISQI